MNIQSAKKYNSSNTVVEITHDINTKVQDLAIVHPLRQPKGITHYLFRIMYCLMSVS